MSKNEGLIRKFAIGAVLSAIAGYIAGVLTAPKSGKETREDIKNKAVETYSTAEKELKRLHAELTDILADASEKVGTLRGKSEQSLDEMIEKGKRAKEKTREVLSSLHDGEAEDEDLKKAIHDATKAIENLRTYLKK